MSANYTFNHNLNFKYVVVQAYDTNDVQIIPSEVKAVDKDNTFVRFADNQNGVISHTKIMPYIDNSNIRTFSKDVNTMDLIWHMDDEDRNIEVLEGKGWKFQRDDELPLELTEGIRIFIPRHQVHRVIKGDN